MTIRKIITRKPLIIAFLACVALAGLYFVLFGSSKAVATVDARFTVQRMDLEDVVSSLGKLEPATYVDVGAQISGQLLQIHVELGSVVQKGDLLAEIDPRTHAAKVEADKANLAQLEANLAERRANLVQAERNYKRDKALFEQNATSEMNMHDSQTAYEVCKAQVASIQAQIRQARASLESDELNLSYCKIYAPISGTVVTLDVKEGQTINSSQTAPTLLRIAELNIMTVWASVSEADISKLYPGMDVYFTTIGDSSTRYYAKVDKIHPSYTEENDVILYDVVFDVENPDGIFLPAMNTQVFFIRAQAKDVLGIPLAMLPNSQRAASEARLSVVLPDGKQEIRKVQLGVRTRTAVEVLSGLNEGEVIAQTSPGLGGSRPGGGQSQNRPPMSSGPRL